MSELSSVVLGFLAGEALLILVLVWTYAQLKESGFIHPHSSARTVVLTVFLFLPVVVALVLLPGIIARLNQALAILPRTGSPPSSSIPATFTPQMRAPTENLATPTPPPTMLPANPQPSPGSPTPPSTGTTHPGTLTSTQAFTTTNTGTSTVPSTPSTGPVGKIVYVCQIFQDTSRDQLCLVNADGSNYRRISRDEDADYNYPSLAPDGQSVVYASNETGEYQIYEMRLEDGQVNRLTDGVDAHLGPVISHDGKTIVFNLKTVDSNAIWVMNRDGSQARQIFGPPQGEGWDPAWSPDDSLVLFASNLPGSVQLYTLRLDGSSLHQVTQLEGLRGRGDWSPDGQVIATYVGEPWQREIYLINADGSNPHAITQGGNNLSPGFSPDGQWMVFTSYRDHFNDENGCEIYVMPSQGGEATRLTDNDFCDWQPSWGH